MQEALALGMRKRRACVLQADSHVTALDSEKLALGAGRQLSVGRWELNAGHVQVRAEEGPADAVAVGLGQWVTGTVLALRPFPPAVSLSVEVWR